MTDTDSHSSFESYSADSSRENLSSFINDEHHSIFQTSSELNNTIITRSQSIIENEDQFSENKVQIGNEARIDNNSENQCIQNNLQCGTVDNENQINVSATESINEVQCDEIEAPPESQSIDGQPEIVR